MMQDPRTSKQALAGLFDFDTDMLMSNEFSRAPQPQAPQQPQMSIMDIMDERKGKFKNRLGLFSHLMLGGDASEYGDADLLAAQKATQAQDALTQKMGLLEPYIAGLNSDNPQEQAMSMVALSQAGLTEDMMEMMVPSLANSTDRLPDATRAVIHYQDSLNRYVDEETGEVMMRQPGDDGYVKYADAFDRYKNREIGGLREQAAAKAGGAEQAKLDVNEAAKNESQKPQMEVAYDLVSSILDDPNKAYHNAYGVIDAMTPTVRQETADVESKIKQIGDILYMFARGELKGQGQVTEQEAEAARNAASRITNMRMSEAEAEDELRRLQKMFGQRIGSPGQGGQSSGPPSYSQFEEDARARGITDPVMISAKYKELYGG
jgi:hypothetical protein